MQHIAVPTPTEKLKCLHYFHREIMVPMPKTCILVNMNNNLSCVVVRTFCSFRSMLRDTVNSNCRTIVVKSVP